MAELVKVGKPSVSTALPPNNSKDPCIAGEAIAAGDACYIKATDGRAYKSVGAAAGAAAAVIGLAAMDAPVGGAVTLFHDVRFGYGAGLTPGAKLYLSGTVPGGLADAPSTGGTQPIGYVFDATRICVWQSRY